MKNIAFPFFLIAAFLFHACSASTGSRYEKTEKKEEKEKTEVTTETRAEEDFDFAPYRTEFEFPETDTASTMKKVDIEMPDVWYTYNNIDTLSENRTSSGKEWGYRVQVLATDNLDEANSARSDLYFKTNQKSIYIIFDPPFYKVKAGDFKSAADANSLNFKLNQMGFTESRVVQDSINIFK